VSLVFRAPLSGDFDAKQNILYQISRHEGRAGGGTPYRKKDQEQVLQAELERLEKANERVHEIESGLSEQRKNTKRFTMTKQTMERVCGVRTS
jgi:hypothetical protein